MTRPPGVRRARVAVPTRRDAPFAIVEGHEMLDAVAFLDVSREVVLVAVLACDHRVPMKKELATFRALIETARLAPERRPRR